MVKKRSKSSSKGSAFEREVCRKLSLWWTHNERDDVFWRASQSGGRATTRSKRGKSTANSAGDVAYLDAIGKPLLDDVCIEIKRGYTAQSDTTGLIDMLPLNRQPLLYKFIEQAKKSQQNAGAMYWMLIQKRDKRELIVHIPMEMFVAINEYLDSLTVLLEKLKYVQITVIPDTDPVATASRFAYFPCTANSVCIVSTPLSSFLSLTPPEFFM
ncbi:MAG: hypothetical protein LBH59_09235 [Planctomycetaceae bacterium]|jgi:hypothetical protein|nr:hypothetical protein [Planctomycetaceae bacterium]